MPLKNLIYVIVLGFISGCIQINPTYSSLGKKEQERLKPVDFNGNPTPLTPATAQEIMVQSITYDQVQTLMKKNADKYKWIIIYTSQCSGTPYILPYSQEIEKQYRDLVAVIRIASDDYATMDYLKKTLFKYGIFSQTYIINNSYGEYKDDRKKGKKLTDELCLICQSDPIGVPYNIVFDKHDQVVWKGYRKYQKINDTIRGEDFISNIIHTSH